MASLGELYIFLSCLGLVHVQAHGSSSLHLWNDEKELDTKTLTIPTGATVGVVCDGSLVGRAPHLAWYGPDKRRIETEGLAYRISSSSSQYGQHRKLTVRNFQKHDEGKYTCLGRQGRSGPWKHVQVTIVQDKRIPSVRLLQTVRQTVRPTVRPTVRSTVPPTAPPKTKQPTTHIPVVTTTWELVWSRTVPKKSTPLINTTDMPYYTTTTDATDTNTTECFQCGTGECINAAFRCDGYPDCIDSLDEKNCNAGSCAEGTTACRDGIGCMSADEECDGVAQCPDGSDEDPKICTAY